MHVEAGVVLKAQRQAAQELAGLGPQLAPGPGHGGLRVGVHGLPRLCHGLIVVARHGDGAALGFLHDALHDFLGFGPVPHIIAQEDQTVGLLCLRVVKAGFQRAQIGVEICHQGNAHGSP